MDYETLSRGVQSVPIELRIKSLKGRIQAELNYIKKEISRTQSRPDYDKDERMFILNDRLSYCKEVSEIPINDDKDFEFVEWLFNGGRYRTSEEIEKKSKEFQRRAEEERVAKIKESEEYQKNYNPVAVYIGCFFGLPLIVAFLAMGNNGGLEGYEVGEAILEATLGGAFIWAFGVIPDFIISALITWLYVENHAAKFDVPIDEDVMCAVAGATVAGCTTYYLKTKIDKQKEATKTV